MDYKKLYEQEKKQNKKLKDFALKVHNFTYWSILDDDSIVSAMDFDGIIEEMESTENTLKHKLDSTEADLEEHANLVCDLKAEINKLIGEEARLHDRIKDYSSNHDDDITWLIDD